MRSAVSTVSECEANYKQMLTDSGIVVEEEKPLSRITGTITRIVPTVIDGNTHYYVFIDDKNTIYDVNVKNNPSIVLYETGVPITLEYAQGEGVMTSNLP